MQFSIVDSGADGVAGSDTLFFSSRGPIIGANHINPNKSTSVTFRDGSYCEILSLDILALIVVKSTRKFAEIASLETFTSVYAEPQSLEFYVRPDGTIPFNEWFSSIRSSDAQQAIHTRIVRLHAGNLGDYKRLDSELYELKLRHRPGYRIYFCKPEPNAIMLLHGGTKKNQQADIEKARFYIIESQEHQP